MCSCGLLLAGLASMCGLLRLRMSSYVQKRNYSSFSDVPPPQFHCAWCKVAKIQYLGCDHCCKEATLCDQWESLVGMHSHSLAHCGVLDVPTWTESVGAHVYSGSVIGTHTLKGEVVQQPVSHVLTRRA
jgi:hypothetical protein